MTFIRKTFSLHRVFPPYYPYGFTSSLSPLNLNIFLQQREAGSTLSGAMGYEGDEKKDSVYQFYSTDPDTWILFGVVSCVLFGGGYWFGSKVRSKLAIEGIQTSQHGPIPVVAKPWEIDQEIHSKYLTKDAQGNIIEGPPILKKTVWEVNSKEIQPDPKLVVKKN